MKQLNQIYTKYVYNEDKTTVTVHWNANKLPSIKEAEERKFELEENGYNCIQDLTTVNAITGICELVYVKELQK